MYIPPLWYLQACSRLWPPVGGHIGNENRFRESEPENANLTPDICRSGRLEEGEGGPAPLLASGNAVPPGGEPPLSLLGVAGGEGSLLGGLEEEVNPGSAIPPGLSGAESEMMLLRESLRLERARADTAEQEVARLRDLTPNGIVTKLFKCICAKLGGVNAV